jgi:hypothetical protein
MAVKDVYGTASSVVELGMCAVTLNPVCAAGWLVKEAAGGLITDAVTEIGNTFIGEGVGDALGSVVGFFLGSGKSSGGSSRGGGGGGGFWDWW